MVDFFITKQTSLHPFDFVRNLFHLLVPLSVLLDHDNCIDQDECASWPSSTIKKLTLTFVNMYSAFNLEWPFFGVWLIIIVFVTKS